MLGSGVKLLYFAGLIYFNSMRIFYYTLLLLLSTVGGSCKSLSKLAATDASSVVKSNKKVIKKTSFLNTIVVTSGEATIAASPKKNVKKSDTYSNEKTTHLLGVGERDSVVEMEALDVLQLKYAIILSEKPEMQRLPGRIDTHH